MAAACAPDLPTYCLFNNIFMAEDAIRLRGLLSERSGVARGRDIKVVK